jgi:hypothetical protein
VTSTAATKPTMTTRPPLWPLSLLPWPYLADTLCFFYTYYSPTGPHHAHKNLSWKLVTCAQEVICILWRNYQLLCHHFHVRCLNTLKQLFHLLAFWVPLIQVLIQSRKSLWQNLHHLLKWQTALILVEKTLILAFAIAIHFDNSPWPL